MQRTCSNANEVSSILALAINKKVVKAKTGFFEVPGTWLNNDPFSDSYNTLLD